MTPPSADKCCTIIATPGVVTMSRSITSMPEATSAPIAASRTQVPLGRLSRPNTIFNGADCELSNNQAANAAAICVTTVGVKLPPTVPRVPETPIMSGSMVGVSLAEEGFGANSVGNTGSWQRLAKSFRTLYQHVLNNELVIEQLVDIHPFRRSDDAGT